MMSPQQRSGLPVQNMMQRLAQPSAFPFPLAPAEPLIRQTHLSVVFLAAQRAYKVKKTLRYDFCDYSTLTLRRQFCIAEVRLNARLAPDVYYGVAPILEGPDGLVRFGEPLLPDDVPLPGVTVAGATVVEYAVVMQRLAEEETLAERVRRGTITAAELTLVAQKIAHFHQAAPTTAHITAFGADVTIARNWAENLAQMRALIGTVLPQETYDRINVYVHDFLQQHAALFVSRMQHGYIRDGHGDLRPEHIYLSAATTTDAMIHIIDCIEFAERFRCGDVASDIAFLMMELDAAGRCDLARVCITAYSAATGDHALGEMLPFYGCYRACVRGKVLTLLSVAPGVPALQREQARHQAEQYFALAALYAHNPTVPTLVLIGGLMGTGKSTLAAQLSAEAGWTLIASDRLRKAVVVLPLSLRIPQLDHFGQGIYSAGWTEKTYQVLDDAARIALRSGHSVILDASFARRAYRQHAAAVGAEVGARVVFIACHCPRVTALARLSRRWHSRSAHLLAETDPTGVSDGRPALYEAQRAQWEPFVASAEPDLLFVSLATAARSVILLEQVLDVLGLVRLACWL